MVFLPTGLVFFIAKKLLSAKTARQKRTVFVVRWGISKKLHIDETHGVSPYGAGVFYS